MKVCLACIRVKYIHLSRFSPGIILKTKVGVNMSLIEEILSKYDNMAPRERDCWIADKIFNRKINYLLPLMYKTESIEYCKQNNPNILNGTVVQIIKPYSTCISSSWEVVNKLIDRGFHVNVYINDAKACSVGILKKTGDYLPAVCNTHCATFPESICKAALIAISKP
jgi:hypothetical protein